MLHNPGSTQITEQHIACPHCPSSDAYCVYSDGHGYCFSCNTYTPPDNKFEREVFTYEFLPTRGLVRDTLRHYDIKTKIDNEGKPIAVGFKYANGSYKIRLVDKKEFYTEGEINKAGLFGKDKFAAGSHKYVTVTEGEYDAASLYQILRSPVVSVQSSSVALRDCTVDREYLNSFERIYIAFDSDAHGKEAMERVAKLFDYDKVYIVKFSNRKDANEYLQAGEGDELRNIWWNAKKYCPEFITSSLEDFGKLLEHKPKWGVPYPFKQLTDMTYGIRTGETILITAQEGIGKTELMHAIEYKILTETQHAVGAIFLEEPPRRHLQALAGIHLKKPVHLPDQDCSPDQVRSALEEVVQVDDRLHILAHYGSMDPELFLESLRFLVVARGCRYVMFDHISMVLSGSPGSVDERRTLDYISTKLEMMVKELDFCLIMVSHVNDEGKTRGSRGISKLCDTRIDVTRDLLNTDPIVRCTIVLSISKNRFGMKTGPAGRVFFDQAKYSYVEADNDNGPPTSEFGGMERAV